MAVTAPAAAIDCHASRATPILRRSLALTSDLRFELFAGLFALATIHHVLQQALEHRRVGPLGEYMERWGRARPSMAWPSELGMALHTADLVIALLMLVLPYRRALLSLLAITFLPTNLASPERIPSHNSLMAAAATLVLGLALAEAIERAWRRGRVGTEVTDWYRWTATGLPWLLVITYVFAFIYKLNTSYLSPSTTRAATFLASPVTPLLPWLGSVQRLAEDSIALVAIYGSLALEISVPFLLLAQRTRLVGCFVGLLLHLPMMAWGIFDFPTLTLAFYPLFLSVSEARWLLAECRRRPSTIRFVGTLAFTAVGIWSMLRTEYIQGLYTDSPGLEPALVFIHSGLLCASLLLFSHIFLTLAAVLTKHRWSLGKAADRVTPMVGVSQIG